MGAAALLLILLFGLRRIRSRRRRTAAAAVPPALTLETREPFASALPAPPAAPLVQEPASRGAAAVAAPPVSKERVEAEPARAGLRTRLLRTREAVFGRLPRVLAGRSLDAAVLEEVEALLFGADLGVKTAEDLLGRLRRSDAADARAALDLLRAAVAEKLRCVEATGDPFAAQGKPHVILVLGVNGSGKTTTIGKLAARFAAAGKQVLLGAGDTFRAAASEQLEVWGQRVGCPVITGAPGGDPAAVAFDALKAARAREADVVIIDTAGRLQTKKPLMEELGKIARVIAREVPGAPHDTLLVLDANTGQNAISQARLFTEVAPISGLVLTKLDGTAKGGVLVGLADEFGIPVKFIGVGESADDLRVFSAEEFTDALFPESAASEAA